MKIINAKVHGILDYCTVIFLLISPALFDMKGKLGLFTYALGGIHLVLTIFTNYQLGLFKRIPFKVHGLIELVVAILLVAIAFLFRYRGNSTGFNFYLVLSIVFFIVLSLTDFTTADTKLTATTK